jgi:hypothetical protein
MKLLRYKDVLALTKEKLDEAKAPFRAKEMRKRAELTQIELESTIAACEQRLSEECSKYPINFERLADTMDELRLTEHRHNQFTQIIHEMFGTEQPDPAKPRAVKAA